MLNIKYTEKKEYGAVMLRIHVFKVYVNIIKRLLVLGVRHCIQRGKCRSRQ